MMTCLDEAVECVDVVADDGSGEKVTNTVTREEAQKKRELTWTSQAVVNVDGYELVTLRGNGNKKYAGQWEIGVTESRRHGESNKEAVHCGLAEELLIPREKQGRTTHLFDVFYRSSADSNDRKNVAVYRYFHGGPVRYDTKEIAAALLLPYKAVGWAIATQTMKFTPMNISVHHKLVETGVYR